MPSFLNNLRRKTSRSARLAGKNGHSNPDGQPAGQNGNGLSHRVSASTLNSSQVDSSTPSTTPATSTTEDGPAQTKDHTNGPTPLPARPQRPSVEPVKRYSMNVCTNKAHNWVTGPLMSKQGLSSPVSNGSNGSLNRSSLLAPRIISISDNSWVSLVSQMRREILTMCRSTNKSSCYSAKSARPITSLWTVHSRLTTIRAASRRLAGRSMIHISRHWCIWSLAGIEFVSTLPRPKYLPAIPQYPCMLRS